MGTDLSSDGVGTKHNSSIPQYLLWSPTTFYYNKVNITFFFITKIRAPLKCRYLIKYIFLFFQQRIPNTKRTYVRWRSTQFLFLSRCLIRHRLLNQCSALFPPSTKKKKKPKKSSKKSPANSFSKSPPKSLSQANSKTVIKDLVPNDPSAIFDVQISKLVDAIAQQLRGVSDLVSDKAIDPSNKKMIDAPSSDPSSVRKTVIDDLLLDPSSVNKVLVTTRPTH